MTSRSLVHLTVAAACLTACHKNETKASSGSAEAPAAPAKAAPSGNRGVTLHAKLTVSGSVTGTAEFTQQVDATSCADFAAKFELPSSDDAKLSNGQKVALSDSVTKYHGPGTYAAADLDQSAATLSINNSDEPYQPLGKDSTRSLTVNSDGSGTYAFANWPNPGSNVVSGTLTWTCGS